MENSEDMKKLFDPKEYSTKIVGAESDDHEILSTKKEKIKTLIALLTEEENKDVKEETLITLKKENAGSMLIDAIRQNRSHEKRKILIAACWESEINFSHELPLFTELACDEDYLASLEAMTVIENMEGPFEEEILEESIRKVREAQKEQKTERLVLLNDLAATLESFRKNQA
jgi:hypothetical protein